MRMEEAYLPAASENWRQYSAKKNIVKDYLHGIHQPNFKSLYSTAGPSSLSFAFTPVVEFIASVLSRALNHR